MYNIIKNYVENETTNGLILIDMPTGSGKTYSAIEYIFDACLNENNKARKYIFVTTLKKNLPHEDLKVRFEKAGKSELYDEKVLVIDSNLEAVISGWSDAIKEAIPREIRKTDEYKRFSQDVEFIMEQRKMKHGQLRDFVQSIERNLREHSEPAFRHVLSEYLAKEYKTVAQRILAVKTEKKWQWIVQLYPAVFTREKQVIFMSMDKLLSRNTTIVEPSYMFYNSDVIKDAVLFIDEFDATKETVLKKIIENGLRDKVDYVELFKDIYAALHTDTFPTILTTPSEERKKGKYKTQTLESVIEGIKEKADYIFATYSLQFKHRTSGNMADLYQNYLFQDHQFHSILNGNNSYITMTSDSKKRINNINFSISKPEHDNNNIQIMLGQLRGFIKYFQGAVNILAINYMQWKAEHREEGEDVFTLESSIRSVLALFRLSKENINYLTSQIMMTSHKTKGDIEPSEFDLSFYEHGFRYYGFENDTHHDMQSQIMMYSFQNTPEKMLLRFCEKAKVIGISATATVPSVLGNYDISYLKNKMQKVYVELHSEEKQRLIKVFETNQSGYKDIDLSVDLLGEKGNYSEKSWQMVFEDKECSQHVYEKIQRLFGEKDDENNYHKDRYLRIALAYKQFILHDDIYSFLCVLTKHPKKGDKYLDRNILEYVFDLIAKRWKPGFNVKKSIMMLDGAEYDDKKNDMVERLARGEKLFVISVYQTIGAGQNLQYPVPNLLKGTLVKINNRSMKDEKDFDAIYLDKPTNLIVPLGANMDESEFVKYLFQMEFLQEASEISASEAMTNVKKAFKTFITGNLNHEAFANVYLKKSVVLLSTRYIIQAIGRICRTNQKNKTIYIFADNKIAENIDLSVVEGRIYNPEFMALLEKIREVGGSTCEEASLANEASLKAVRVNKNINNMLSNDWTEAKIEKWKALRKLVLECPTASKEQAAENFVIKNYYARLPEAGNVLFYDQEADYNNISIAFERDRNHNQMVSEIGSKLPDMLRIPSVRKLFEENGWATEFAINDYVMTPPLWNNIYKGALGEVVGCHWFKKALNVELEEIDDINLFELFDYKVPNASVFVDFKNWHEGMTTNKSTMIDKISCKAAKCGCKCVIVANVMAQSNYEISEVEKGGVRILTVPYLVVDKDGVIYADTKARDEIRRCINDYKD